jgi:hypothetical protein
VKARFHASHAWRDAAIFAALWLGLLVAGHTAFLQDPGVFWHVAAGRRMLTASEVLRSDPFGLASYGRPWIPMQWLAEIGMAVLYAAGGFTLIVATSATMLALTYASLARHLLRSGIRPALATALLVVVIRAGSPQFIARPLLFTLLLVGWTFAALLRFEQEGGDRVRGLFLLPPVLVLWTNLHGGAAAGLAMVLLTSCGWMLAPSLGLRRLALTRREAIAVAWVNVAALGAVFMNPFGADLPRAWIALFSSRALPRVIIEHAPPALSSRGDFAFPLLAIVYLAVWAGIPRRAQRVTFLVPLLWMVLGLRSMRHVPLFALTAAWALPAMLSECAWLQRALAKRRDSPFAPRMHTTAPSSRTGLVASSALALALALVLSTTQSDASPLARWVRPAEPVAPFDLLPALHAASQREPEGSGIWNEMIHGGFLILFVPRLRVFIDDRWEVHGDDTFARYARASDEDPAELDAWTGRLGVRLALAPRASPMDRYLANSPGWQSIAQGHSATLYRRRSDITD